MRVAYIKDGKTEFKDLPKTFKNLPCFDKRGEAVWNENGFYLIKYPALSEGEKHSQTGELVGNKYVIDVVDKSPEELAAEAEAKKQVEKEQIKQKYLDRIVSDSVSVADALVLFKEYEPRPYALEEGAIFKGKPFRNTVEGNTNAPDKGGWTEIK